MEVTAANIAFGILLCAWITAPSNAERGETQQFLTKLRKEKLRTTRASS